MQHFPIFISTTGKRIVVSGGGEASLAKLRLLLKTQAEIIVYAKAPLPELEEFATNGQIQLVRRAIAPGDVSGATLFYAADEDQAIDARTAALAEAECALVNVVDNLQASAFITPAIVDRDPVTVAIGTEGAAPVLARAIKADLEERLSPSLGTLAKIGKAFRPMAEKLPFGRKRREFWSSFYFNHGPRAYEQDGTNGAEIVLDELLDQHLNDHNQAGYVEFVGAGPGDPELLTMKARNALDKADVIIHDRLISGPVLELARREAKLIDAGKTGFGPSMKQETINEIMVQHAQDGHHVVRLKSGDPTIFGRLDEEIDALDAAEIEWRIVPGITAASAAVAAIGQSLTKRGRNGSVRFITGHDTKGFAEHDWNALAAPGEVAAIYMGKRSARFVQGRLLMHGGRRETPITVIENASQPNQHVYSTNLSQMGEFFEKTEMAGAALTFVGLAPREAIHAADIITEEERAI